MKKPFDYISFIGFVVGILAFIFSYCRIDYISTAQFFSGHPRSEYIIILLTNLSGAYFVVTVFFKMDRLKRREAAKILEISPKIIELTQLGIQTCEAASATGKIDRIAKGYISAIRNHLLAASLIARSQIPAIIDEGFMDAAFDAKKNKKYKARFESLAASAFNQLINFTELDSFADWEMKKAKREILAELIAPPRRKDLSTYTDSIADEIDKGLKELNLKEKRGKIFFWYNPELKNLVTLDYEKAIWKASVFLPLLNMIQTGAPSMAAHTVAGGGLMSAGLFPTDFSDLATDTLQDFAQGEILGHLAAETAEWALAAVPFVGIAFLGIKLIRYAGLAKRIMGAGRFLEKIRARVEEQLASVFTRLTSEFTEKADDSCHQLVNEVQKRYMEVQKKVRVQMAIAQKYA